MTTGRGAYARNTDPTTSQEAANSLSDGCLTALQKIVVDILKAHSSGLTVPEIAAIADRTVVTISPRIRSGSIPSLTCSANKRQSLDFDWI